MNKANADSHMDLAFILIFLVENYRRNTSTVGTSISIIIVITMIILDILLEAGNNYFTIFKQTDHDASSVDLPSKLEESPVSTVTAVTALKTEKSEDSSQKPKSGSPNDSLPPCPAPSNLTGSLPMEINQEITFEEIINKNPSVQRGGCWRPPDCESQTRLALMIPYRDRAIQLKVLLGHLHWLLQRQLINYCIFVIEQTADAPFNRALLFNAGFVVALNSTLYGYEFVNPIENKKENTSKESDSDSDSELRKADITSSPAIRRPVQPNCLILHDVDMLPEDDRNIYRCGEQPRHLAVAVEKHRYRLPYPGYFGGVCSLTPRVFADINGASNKYFGWGGEGLSLLFTSSTPTFHLLLQSSK